MGNMAECNFDGKANKNIYSLEIDLQVEQIESMLRLKRNNHKIRIN